MSLVAHGRLCVEPVSQGFCEHCCRKKVGRFVQRPKQRCTKWIGVVPVGLTSRSPPECFAAGVTAAIDDPTEGVALASRLRAQPAGLAATAERYGLAPTETATILRDAGAPAAQTIATLGQLCGYDDNAVEAAWRGDSIETPEVTTSTVVARSNVRSIGGNEIGTAEELLAVLPLNGRSSPRPPELFDMFPMPTEPVGLLLEPVKR